MTLGQKSPGSTSWKLNGGQCYGCSPSTFRNVDILTHAIHQISASEMMIVTKTTDLCLSAIKFKLEMCANAQPDGRPAEHRWRPLFNAAKFG